MIGQEDDGEVVQDVQLAQLVDHPGELRVHPLDHPVVGGRGPVGFAIGHVLPHLDLEEVRAIEVLGHVLLVRLDPPQVIGEQIVRALVGIVRRPQAHRHQQRGGVGAVVGLVHEVLVQEHQGAVDRVTVVLHPVPASGARIPDFLLHLVRPGTGAGIALDQGLVLRVVGRLIAVASHDVAPDALVPAMHLVRPHEVHLAGRAGGVAVT